MKKDLNSQFKELEDKYLSTRDANDLGRMYLFIRLHLTKQIKIYARQHKLFYPDIEENVDIGATWFITRYLKDSDFRCKKFTSYIHFARMKGTIDNQIIKEDKIKKLYMEVFNEDVPVLLSSMQPVANEVGILPEA